MIQHLEGDCEDVLNKLPGKTVHGAVFPKDLIRPCILAGCPKGGTLIDPFAAVAPRVTWRKNSAAMPS